VLSFENDHKSVQVTLVNTDRACCAFSYMEPDKSPTNHVGCSILVYFFSVDALSIRYVH